MSRLLAVALLLAASTVASAQTYFCDGQVRTGTTTNTGVANTWITVVLSWSTGGATHTLSCETETDANGYFTASWTPNWNGEADMSIDLVTGYNIVEFIENPTHVKGHSLQGREGTCIVIAELP